LVTFAALQSMRVAESGQEETLQDHDLTPRPSKVIDLRTTHAGSAPFAAHRGGIGRSDPGKGGRGSINGVRGHRAEGQTKT